MERRYFMKIMGTAVASTAVAPSVLAKRPRNGGKPNLIKLVILTILIGILPLSAQDMCGIEPAEVVLADFDDKLADVRAMDGAKVKFSRGVQVMFREAGAGVLITPPKKGSWDLSGYAMVAIDIENLGKKRLSLVGGVEKKAKGYLCVPAGGTGSMYISILRTSVDDERKQLFTGMNGIPGGHISSWMQIKDKAIKKIALHDLDGVSVGQSFKIKAIRGFGKYGLSEDKLEGYFPFVDQFGQFKHSNWAGKVSSLSDLKRYAEVERRDLQANPRPSDRSKFGGWVSGPQRKATGHFRTEKYKGKWWLVDPEGYLFFSHGITGVHSGSSTLLNGRENYFEQLPKGFVQKKKKKTIIEFSKANLKKKYGEEWEQREAQQCFDRLNSWGMNTMGNWSSQQIYEQRKMPYVVAVHYAGSGKQSWTDPVALDKALRERMEREVGHSVDDPWCIGYFVDNELDWKLVMDPEEYYKIVSGIVKEIAPNKLYMGSRIHGHSKPYGGDEPVVRAAVKYCDVLGVNRYRYSPSDLQMLDGVDLPVIIGEFHFGALDRGLFHHGLQGVASQKQRAYAYQHYLVQALMHPNIVGTHWFQFREQLVTGRSDGENYQIGFVDTCDTPYEYMVKAARRVGRGMYKLRSK